MVRDFAHFRRYWVFFGFRSLCYGLQQLNLTSSCASDDSAAQYSLRDKHWIEDKIEERKKRERVLGSIISLCRYYVARSDCPKKTKHNLICRIPPTSTDSSEAPAGIQFNLRWNFALRSSARILPSFCVAWMTTHNQFNFNIFFKLNERINKRCQKRFDSERSSRPIVSIFRHCIVYRHVLFPCVLASVQNNRHFVSNQWNALHAERLCTCTNDMP